MGSKGKGGSGSGGRLQIGDGQQGASANLTIGQGPLQLAQ
jgi:hypothetical protein